MSFTVSLDAERRELFVLASGVITGQDIRQHLAQERDDGALGYRELIDARLAHAAVSAAEVREIVALLRLAASAGRLGPTAVVVSADYAYGMLRMTEMMLDDVAAVRPFRDFAEATEWLAAAPDDGPAGDTTRPLWS